MPAPARRAIARLRRAGHTVVLVSGRRARDAARVAGVATDGVLGSHGAECLRGARVTPWLGRVGDRRRVAAAAARIRSALAGHPGVRLEDKTWSLAVHFHSGPARVRELARRVRRAAADPRLVVKAGRQVVDVRPRGIDKGRAVRRWLGPRPPRGRVLCAGDDTTDRDAFRAVAPLGWTIAVGRHVTGARYRAAGPAAFARWLVRLSERLA